MPYGTSRRRHGKEERELSVLTGELDALAQDIAAARADAPRATRGGLDLHRERDPVPPPRGEPVRLPDGAEIRVRPIEPGDRRQLERGFRRLGALSRYERFRGPADGLTSDQLSYFTQVDHAGHEALVAADARTGEGVGVCRYIRDADDPRLAELACTVADPWQERGVGSALVERLAERARANGIERLRAVLLVDNRRGRRLLGHVADELEERRDGGVVEVTARLRPDAGR